MTLNEHLKELKTRLIISICIMFVAICISYLFADRIFQFLLNPLTEVMAAQNLSRNLIYTSLTEAFITKLKLAIFTGVFFSAPIVAWQIYRFIAPGLFKRERMAFIPYLVFSPILFFTGAFLVYAYIMPLAWSFFISFESDLSVGMPLILEAKISEYISLVISLIIAFGAAFQLPLVLVLLVHVGFLKVEKLVSFRRYAIVLIFLVAAIITPPDVLSQVALAVPLVLLYEISILICKRINRAK
ncbi:MAG: tatC [Candidatus Midichloriaceae bacterium]|nr:tatC [Candidatus Midichloriaceae bacterium]